MCYIHGNPAKHGLVTGPGPMALVDLSSLWVGRERRNVMRRRIWKRVGIVVGVVFVLAGAWAVVGVLLAESEPIPSFAFLEGRAVSVRVERKQKEHARDRVTRVVYSFEADFDTVCSEAEGELLAQGFKKDTQSSEGRHRRWLSLTTDEHMTIDFHHGQKFSEHWRVPRVEPGWVSVDIIHERPSAWRSIARGPLNPLYRWGVLK